MLRYNVKLNESNIKMDELVWGEKYASPDLSFVTGVTSQEYHLEKSNRINATVGGNTTFSSLFISTENVTRNGYVVIKEKEYEIHSGKTSEVSAATFNYVEINGVFYYITGNTITVKNWLKEEWYRVGDEYKVNIIEGDVIGTKSGNVIKLDTIVWIENNTVTIDGHVYLFDKYDKSEYSTSPGGIKYYETGRSLRPLEITKCSDIVYHYFDKVSDYKKVTKFRLTKEDESQIKLDDMSICSYFYYVTYKDYYCPIMIDGNGDYICQVPKKLYDWVEEYSDEYYEYDNIKVKYFDSGVETDINVSIVPNMDDLESYMPFVLINGGTFYISRDIQNTNDGTKLVLYVENETLNFQINDLITLTVKNGADGVLSVMRNGDNGEPFVLFNNEKKLLKANLSDAVDINGIYYDVTYPEGKYNEKDALVDINGEIIPMNIYSDSDGFHLKRYGKIVLSGESEVKDATYNIISFSGVAINDKIYRVFSDAPTNKKYIQINEDVPYNFRIKEIRGSSMLICELDLNNNEFTKEFIDDIREEICLYLTGIKDSVAVTLKNNAFGTRSITPEVGYIYTDTPVSSNDYYDVFRFLVLYSNNGHIGINLPMIFKPANNIIQEDIVERDFFEAEKKKAINPIIDMEKDVYYPKYIEKSDDETKADYRGSATVFHPINEIVINLHFRTRNMTNWKINELYNDSSCSGSDNWFITDYYPYKNILQLTDEHGQYLYDDELIKSSDLMGLLGFIDDDIFYQKDAVGKSFLRLSYYDSTDPNTQNLLATSTVFMDEHSLYQKYINNSRRNVDDYGIIEVVKEEDNIHSISNKISVMGEYLGTHDKRRKNYIINNADAFSAACSADCIQNITENMYTDKKRISSRFTISNKYNTDTSSEGFYIYMFKEYSEKLHPKPIYMKVEFNHAGMGKIIPFIIPMKWTDYTKGNKDHSCYPERALRLNESALKEGYKLSYVQAQSYIPLYAVYDYKNGEYGYVFDDRYAEVDDKNRVFLNLFEIKIKDESDSIPDDDDDDVRKTENKKEKEDVNIAFFKAIQKDVTDNNIERAVININENQFNKSSFNSDVI